MAYGNFPGGGYSGFIKAEKPLIIKNRSYIPVRDTWPPKYESYGEEVSESEALLPKDEIGPNKKRKEKRKPIKVRLYIFVDHP